MRKQIKSILVLGGITVFLAAVLFLSSQILPASERFELVMGGEAVLDKGTGLVWEQSPDTKATTWSGAISYCDNNTTAGSKEWRLPTVGELANLIDRSQTLPALPSGHPFSNVQSAIYWSSSTSGGGSKPGIVFFHCGSWSASDKSHHYVWCVQDGE